MSARLCAGLLALTLCTGCGKGTAEEATARRFLDLYLVAADQEAALTVCTGRARAQLREELDLLAGLEGRHEAVAEVLPRLRIEKVHEKRRPGGDVAFLFRIELARPEWDVPPRDLFVLVGNDAGEPKVKSFSFDPSDSRTSGTP